MNVTTQEKHRSDSECRAEVPKLVRLQKRSGSEQASWRKHGLRRTAAFSQVTEIGEA